jgi:type II secretory pathway pseudopilin PulG
MRHAPTTICSQARWPQRSGSRCPLDQRLGLTLLELLVVVSIMATLVAMLLPAIQTARESARRVHCCNNLKNIATALMTYHDAHKAFPCGGWGHFWAGVPERGVGPQQPGAWIYCLLPYIEERDVHQLGLNLTGADATQLYSTRLQTPISLFVCPSRRACALWAISDVNAYARTPRPFGIVSAAPRSDYAINAGTAHVIGIGGPNDTKQGDDISYWRSGPSTPHFSGISHLRRSAALKSIEDGTSKTYLVGEKHVPFKNYTDGGAEGDNASLYSGFCSDLYRFSGVLENLKIRKPPFAHPLTDTDIVSSGPTAGTRFGSAHAGGFTITYCDGSVNFVDFGIDPEVHLRFGHRSDNGAPLNSLE